MTTEWRKMQIVLEPKLVEKLSAWHDSMHDPIYALSSWGSSHLVSLSMIDAALESLQRIQRKVTGGLRRDLDDVLGDLETLRGNWKESTAKEYGLDVAEYRFDRQQYGHEGTA